MDRRRALFVFSFGGGVNEQYSRSTIAIFGLSGDNQGLIKGEQLTLRVLQ